MSIFGRGRGAVGSRQPTRNIQSENWHPFEKEQDRVTYIFGSEGRRIAIARVDGECCCGGVVAVAPRHANHMVSYSYDGCTIPSISYDSLACLLPARARTMTG